MSILCYIRQLKSVLNNISKQTVLFEENKLLLGKLLVKSIEKRKVNSLKDVEFKIFSQFGEDGIIQWLIHNLDIKNKTFVEFGVEDYRESNTRFLMMNDNWSGFIIDSSKENISKIKYSEYYWKYDLIAKNAFITCKNINNLISSRNFNKEVGILSVDIDGNDYWIWKQIDVINPVVVIIEYNSVFGIDRTITVPYCEKYNRTKTHYSNLYFGASLLALSKLASDKGYALVGCSSAGNNAFFVKKDKINSVVKEASVKKGFILSKFRESRDKNGSMTFLSGNSRIDAIKRMPVFNIFTEKIEKL